MKASRLIPPLLEVGSCHNRQMAEVVKEHASVADGHLMESVVGQESLGSLGRDRRSVQHKEEARLKWDSAIER